MILDAVKTLKHSTAAEIHEHIKARYPNISMGTVYRNLSSMVEERKLNKLSFLEGPDRFEIRFRRHYHAVCSQCGAIVDLEDIPENIFKELDGSVEASTGFSVSSHCLYFTGFCPLCKRDNQ
jgi:Fur family peroxide stress response transcriptional regulator